MRDDTKVLCRDFGLAVISTVLIAVLLVGTIWLFSTLVSDEIAWLEQNGLRGIWCGAGGCDK